MEFRLLKTLDPADARRVLAAARRRTFASGEVLFHEGDPADTVHFLKSGRAIIRKTTADGNVVTMNIVGPGEAVGEQALLGDGGHRMATVSAAEPCETLSVSSGAFAELRREHPSVSEVLVQVLTARVADLSDQLTEALTVGAEGRVRRRLLHMLEVYDDGSGANVVPLSQEDLAGLAGTARATVNRVLRDEQERGTLRLGRGRITVVDPAALRKRAR